MSTIHIQLSTDVFNLLPCSSSMTLQAHFDKFQHSLADKMCTDWKVIVAAFWYDTVAGLLIDCGWLDDYRPIGTVNRFGSSVWWASGLHICCDDSQGSS